jgi:hypothetical protein
MLAVQVEHPNPQDVVQVIDRRAHLPKPSRANTPGMPTTGGALGGTPAHVFCWRLEDRDGCRTFPRAARPLAPEHDDTHSRRPVDIDTRRSRSEAAALLPSLEHLGATLGKQNADVLRGTGGVT